MLIAYMDGSGTHDGAHNCVVAGYWGYVNEWKRFESGWKSVLALDGVDEFHAKEFWPRINGESLGQYKNWSDDRHARFVGRLLGIIERCNIIPFSCGVLGDEWKKVSPFRKAIMSHEKMQKPVLLPLARILYRIVNYCKPGEVMNFVFDEDRKNIELGLAMVERLAAIKNGMKEAKDPLYERIGNFGFEDSKKAYPLQAADLLAYECHRYAKGMDRKLPMRNEYKRALKRMRSMDDFWLFDEKRMATLAKSFDATDARLGESTT